MPTRDQRAYYRTPEQQAANCNRQSRVLLGTPALEATMTDSERMRAHAAAVMKMPAGEQWLSAFMSIVSIAFDDIARRWEASEKRSVSKQPRRSGAVRRRRKNP